MIREIVSVKPRGFCAGVARSVKVVEDCLSLFGAPIYVKHAIVHNKTVVVDLEKKGAVTVEDISEVPDGAVVVFSAHGSPPEQYEYARIRGIRVIDATCPLVTKVHVEMRTFLSNGYQVVYIGHKGHVEGLGVIGEAKKFGKNIPIIETINDVDDLMYATHEKIAFLTQTTLSLEETKDIISALKKKFPLIVEPPSQDICYATTNRQKAIQKLARESDMIIVVGSQTSSNSKRLVEVAISTGCNAFLVDSFEEIQDSWLKDVEVVGVSAGASAPEYKAHEIIDYFRKKGAKHRSLNVVDENMYFTEPVELMKARKKKDNFSS
jgi:4-hydroxy-3-methylbut-2-en-1-yl diphosphate reductase